MTEGDLADLRAALDRLREEFRRLLEAVAAGAGESALGATALARRLGVDRTTCQRLVATLAAGPAEPGMAARLPGVRAMGQMLDAAAGVTPAVDPGRIATCRAAVDGFGRLVRRIGGSQSRLAARLAQGEGADGPGRMEGGARAAAGAGSGVGGGAGAVDEAALREEMFGLASQVTGRFSRVHLAIFGFRPNPERPDRLDTLTGNGVIGHEATRRHLGAAMPLVLMCGRGPVLVDAADYAGLDQASPLSAERSTVLTEFCTRPLPPVAARGPRDTLVHMVDADEPGRPGSPGAPLDFVLGARAEGSCLLPTLDTPPVHEAWVIGHYPALDMVLDVYLHRSLARRCIPSAAAHLWYPNVQESIGDRWYTRVPGAPPRLEVLGAGTGQAGTALYARHKELTDTLFARAGWDPSQFVGYRCAVRHPLWRTGYCVAFDFGAGDESTGG